jgi:hypothetical protein
MAKPQPINLRLIAFAIAGDRMCHHKHDDHPCPGCTINLAIPCELTGFYDVGADKRICRVEVCVPGGRFIWVNPSQLCDEYDPMPVGYWHLRRALLTVWITDTNRHRSYERGLTEYERTVAQDGGL